MLYTAFLAAAGVIVAAAAAFATRYVMLHTGAIDKYGARSYDNGHDAGYDAGYDAGQRDLYDAAQQHVAELGPALVIVDGDPYPPDTGPMPVVNSNNPAFWYPDNVHALRDRLRRLESVELAEQSTPDTWLRDQLNDLHAWAERERDKSARWAVRTARSAPRAPRAITATPLFEIEAKAS